MSYCIKYRERFKIYKNILFYFLSNLTHVFLFVFISLIGESSNYYVANKIVLSQ